MGKPRSDPVIFEFFLEKKGQDVKRIREQIDERVRASDANGGGIRRAEPHGPTFPACLTIFMRPPLPAGTIAQWEAGLNAGMEITYLKAINEALHEEMRRDENVFVMGEDVGRLGRGVQGHRRSARRLWGATALSTRRFPSPDCRRRNRRRDARDAARGRDAVRRFHLLRLRSNRQHGGDFALSATADARRVRWWFGGRRERAFTARSSIRKTPRPGSPAFPVSR